MDSLLVPVSDNVSWCTHARLLRKHSASDPDGERVVTRQNVR